jgi:hypothetical protein
MVPKNHEEPTMKSQPFPISTSITFLLTISLAAVGCAGLQPSERTMLVSGAPYDAPAQGAVLATLDEAAIAALVHARSNLTPLERECMLVGSIVRVDGGYTWQEPQRSGSYFARTKPVVRLRVSSQHVASFVIHPRTGENELDSANERITRREKRIVEADPQHRPIFVLTPSGRLLSHAHDRAPIEIANLRWGRRDVSTATSAIATTNTTNTDVKGRPQESRVTSISGSHVTRAQLVNLDTNSGAR